MQIPGNALLAHVLAPQRPYELSPGRSDPARRPPRPDFPRPSPTRPVERPIYVRPAPPPGVKSLAASLSTGTTAPAPPAPPERTREGTTTPSTAATATTTTPEPEPASTATTVTPPITPPSTLPTEPQEPASQAPLTLKGLMKAWGGNHPDYDMNGDKTVDVEDLIEFIMNWPHDGAPGTPEPADADTPLADTSGGPGPPTGETKVPEELASAARTGPSTGPGGPVDPGETDEPFNETTPKMTLEGLMAAWGKGDTPYDLNGDGTVDVDDLTKFILDWPSGVQTAGGIVADPEGLHRRLDELTRLRDTFLDKLANVGFRHQPPSNLPQLVDGFRLDGPSREYVMGKIGARFPQGLGVNLVG